MAFDYSTLFDSEDNSSDTWREIYNLDLPLSLNLVNLLKQTILLPHDFYDIIAAYFLLPSALCRIVPYLFLYGASGSGKSTVAKLGSYLHGVDINSSSDTFAGIRNSLNTRRYGLVELPSGDPKFPTYHKEVEQNTCMIWDDVDAGVFVNNPDLYRLFKFGYDRTTDKIILSSKEVGENLEFHCFCPKVFSSISPLHLDDRFRELKRRLIVIPCRRVEDLTETRQVELGVTKEDWQSKILDLSSLDWKGFSNEFKTFWDMSLASSFVTTRKILSKTTKGLSSQQRAISLDLLACGIASGIWIDEFQAIAKVKNYWDWFKTETDKSGTLSSLLKQFIKSEAINCKKGGQELTIYTPQLRGQINIWVAEGWLYEKPKSTQVKEAMLDLGMRLQQGRWVKG